MARYRVAELTTSASSSPRVLPEEEWPIQGGPFAEFVRFPPGLLPLGNGTLSTGTADITRRDHLTGPPHKAYRYDVYQWSTGGEEDLIARQPQRDILPDGVAHWSEHPIDVISVATPST